MELYYSSLSDVGNVRTNNEDCLFTGKLKKDCWLFVVADGMGGHDAGEVASYEAVTMLTRALKKETDENLTEALKNIVLDINEALINKGKKVSDHKGMGTTLSALYIKKNLGYVVHVGDSRIYRHSKSGLVQLTEDHSLVGKLLKNGFITESEAQSHPKRNVLYQSVGLKQGIEVQTMGPFPVRMGQKFLLCSDGLNNEVPDSEIEHIMHFKSTRQIVDHLIQRAKAGTAADNITVVAVSTEEDDSTEIDKTVRLTVPVNVRKKRKKKVGLLILLGLLVLLLAALIYFLVQDSQKEGDGRMVSPPVAKGGDNGRQTIR